MEDLEKPQNWGVGACTGMGACMGMGACTGMGACMGMGACVGMGACPGQYDTHTPTSKVFSARNTISCGIIPCHY